MLRISATVLLTLAYAAMGQPGPASRPVSQLAHVKTYLYKKTPQANLNIYVHFPVDWKRGDKRPAIIFFFGGGWKHGSAEQFSRQAEYLAGRGMVAARADYRVYDRHKVAPDKCVEDARSAVRWMRKKAKELGIDPDRIAASGGSAGGHLAACTGLDIGPQAEGENRSVSSKANALVLFNPVLDTTHARIIERLGNNQSLAEEISPYHHLRKDGPPTLILFGTNDRLSVQAPPYIARAKELGNRVELYTADGAVHGFFNDSPWYERALRRMDEFLIKIGYLKGEPTIRAETKPAS